MNKPNTQTHQMTRSLYTSQLLLLNLLFSLILATGCSTTCRKREDTKRVLAAQGEVMKKLQAERDDERVKRKVEADPALHEAETHLKDALKAMLDANETVQSTAE